MSHSLLIVSGHDRPGIVSAVTGLLARENINLEDLRMSILEGEFAMMVVIHIPKEKAKLRLNQQLKLLGSRWTLRIFQCPLGALKKARSKNTPKGKGDSFFIIRVLGKDKAGIVAGISRLLADHRINITDLQCRILGRGKKALYAMVLECGLPRRVQRDKLESALKRLSRRMDVDIQFEKADVVHL